MLPLGHGRPIRALVKRDTRRHFTNPAGYVFLTLFVTLSGVAAFWRPRFFLNNLATLDQLVEVFPYLLAFFVPTLTMGTWTDERTHGTDELLLTLPVTDAELVAGKYLSALGIYTASVFVSVGLVFVLMWLGNPDPGLMLANYLGFWLAGAALIPAGMLASLITANTTMAFILGSVFCMTPVGLPAAVGALSGFLGRRMTTFGLVHHFAGFAEGFVGVSAVVYFASILGFFLYLNVVVLGRRFWPDQRRRRCWLHHSLRVVALAILLGSVVTIAARISQPVDLTVERLHSLNEGTRRLVASLPPDRSVMIQAFVSPTVPQVYVETRETLLSVLRSIEAIAGGRIIVVVDETTAFSEEAQHAQRRFGIVPRRVSDPLGDGTAQDVYLGMAVTSAPEEQVIPFLERGLSAEYELSRALRVVTRSERRRVGIIDADVKVFGGINYSTNQTQLPWAVVDELRKQYDVVEITPYDAITEDVDALLLLLPSRLTISELELVTEPIRKGVPALILVDPLPLNDMTLAPAAPMAAQIDPYRKRDPSVQVNYGDIRKVLYELGVNWVPARIAWDSFNAHPEMQGLPAEAVFVTPASGNPEAINRRHAVTRTLRELLLLYPGYLTPDDSNAFEFEPLLQTGTVSGTTGFFQVTRPTPSGPVLAGSATHEPEGRFLTLAAHVRSKAPVAPPRPTNIIVVADLDLISDYFFELRAAAPAGVTFDNIAFFLNAIDMMAGDTSFIPLRTSPGRLRTLTRVEAQTRSFLEQRSREERQAEQDAQQALQDARDSLQSRIKELKSRRDLDELAREIMVRNLEAAEQRRLRALESSILAERNTMIEASRQTMETRIRRIRGIIRLIAVLLPPLPVMLIGAVIFAQRKRHERESARLLGRLRRVP